MSWWWHLKHFTQTTYRLWKCTWSWSCLQQSEWSDMFCQLRCPRWATVWRGNHTFSPWSELFFRVKADLNGGKRWSYPSLLTLFHPVFAARLWWKRSRLVLKKKVIPCEEWSLFSFFSLSFPLRLVTGKFRSPSVPLRSVWIKNTLHPKLAKPTADQSPSTNLCQTHFCFPFTKQVNISPFTHSHAVATCFSAT